MAQGFEKDFWESHWKQAGEAGQAIDPNPHLVRETSGLTPGSALDAGCGEGAEAIWLAGQGWQVTAADISTEALSRATERAGQAGAASDRIDWVEADLGSWEPERQFDLVTTHYAHLPTSQLEFYSRISGWVAPGGTLLIVGHGQTPDAAGAGHGHGHHPPEEASVTATSVAAVLNATDWDVVTAEESVRTLTNRTGEDVSLSDVVVRATRR